MPDLPESETIGVSLGDTEIRWTVREHIGTEVLSVPPDMKLYLQSKDFAWPEDFTPVPITEKEAIKTGSLVCIPGLFGGIGTYEVTVSEDGSVYAQSGDMMGILEFGEDDRNCWVCGGLMNVAAIKRLEIMR